MTKRRKDKRREQAAERRQRELERLQKAVEEQRATAPAPGGQQPAPTPLPPSPPAAIPFPSPLPPGEAEETEEDRQWAQFEEADTEGKVAFFLDTLAAGELDDEYAFEILEGVRAALDLRDAQARARYAELVERLRQQAPAAYHQSIAYYHESLISDAAADGHWEALPELLEPFADGPDLDMFSRVIERLMYHGQIRPLIQVMSRAWPQVSKSADFLPWAIEEFASQLMTLQLFDYLETAPTPRPDDPALLEATAPYGEWQAGWLERFIPRLTAAVPSPWQPADFGEAVDADRWHENLNNLLAEFVADRQRAGVPYSRGYMAWTQLADVLERQFAVPAGRGSRRGQKAGSGKKGRQARPHARTCSLVPTYETMDRRLGELFPLLGSQPYKALAVLELLPAYLHFVACQGLIHPTEMDRGLEELSKLLEPAHAILSSHGADARAMDALTAAWSAEALSVWQDDPALAQARATPPAPPSRPAEPPPRRPGALQTYTFQVTYLRKPDVWRTIEIAENQTLDDLHDAIQEAVDFDADHLYSFYMSGRAWDEDTEYTSPHGEGPSAARAKIGDLNLRMKQRFLYLFDFGDEHHFEIQLVGINPDAPKGDYPRVVERHGKNPRQY